MMKLKLWNSHRFLIILLFVLYQESIAQHQNIPLQHSLNIEIEKRILKDSAISHTSFKPILESRISFKPKSLEFLNSGKSWALKKLFHEHFIQLDSEDVQLFIDPILNFEFGEDNGNSARDVNHYVNTRGFQLRLNLGEKVSIQSSFRENQANLISYVHERTRFSREAFGQGRVKKFGDDGFDFNMASSVFSYSPSSQINIQFGHGKHFVGQGYRSFLLSDLSYNYPFIRLNTTWFDDKVSYQNVFALFQSLQRLPSDFESEGLFQRQQAAIHYLEYSPLDKLSIGLFESVLWMNKDTSDFNPAGINYWIPIVMMNSLIDDNALSSNLGITLNYSGIKRMNVYGQLASTHLTDSAANFQLGAKYYLKKTPIRLQVEYNSSGHADQRFSHYESSLTHPVQSDFSEWIFGIVFKKNRIWSSAQYNMIQNSKQEMHFVELRQSYFINQSSSIAITAGWRYRTIEMFNQETNFIFFGLTTNLQNLYFDY